MSSSEGPTDEQYLSPLPTFAFIKQTRYSLSSSQFTHPFKKTHTHIPSSARAHTHTHTPPPLQEDTHTHPTPSSRRDTHTHTTPTSRRHTHTPSRRHTHHSRRHKEKQTATHFLNGDNLVGVLVSGLVNRGKLDRKTGVMLNL